MKRTVGFRAVGGEAKGGSSDCCAMYIKSSLYMHMKCAVGEGWMCDGGNALACEWWSCKLSEKSRIYTALDRCLCGLVGLHPTMTRIQAWPNTYPYSSKDA